MARLCILLRGKMSKKACHSLPYIITDAARYDFKNKRIGLIGGGSSSVQIIPKLQAVEGAQLNCFIRSKMWISNPFGDYVMDKLGLDKTKLDCMFYLY